MALVLSAALVAVGAGYGAPEAHAVASSTKEAELPATQYFSAVGCGPSGTTCMAAGQTAAPASSAGDPVVVLVTPYGPGPPISTDGVFIHAISCPSDGLCIGVGENDDNSVSGSSQASFVPLYLNQGVIATTPTPGQLVLGVAGTPLGGTTSLAGVDCVSSHECVAIGSGGLGATIVTFDPKSPLATPGQVTSSTVIASAFTNLRGVACESMAVCVVGGDVAGGGSAVATYDPATTAFGPRRPVAGYVAGLACDALVAVCPVLTNVDGPAGEIVAVDARTGTLTGATVIPGGGTGRVPGGGGASYSGISCPALSGRCLAVGSVNTDLSNYRSPTRSLTVSVVLAKTSTVLGAAQRLPATDASDSLLAVACPTSLSCIGVGAGAPAGGPGQTSTGTVVALTGAGHETVFASPNHPDGTPCPANGKADDPVPGGSLFQAVKVHAETSIGAVHGAISAADECYDATSNPYPSSWVMLESAPAQAGVEDTFIQAGIAYHPRGGPDVPFVELSPNIWTSDPWSPPAADGMTVGSSIEFPGMAATGGTFSIVDHGKQTSTHWCGWVPAGVRSHPSLEGSYPVSTVLATTPADEYEIDMNGVPGSPGCLWIFYLPVGHDLLTQADAAAEVHTAWSHVPGSPTSPLGFTALLAYTDKWHSFATTNAGLTRAYRCDVDGGRPTGSGAGFDTWGSMWLNTAFEPGCRRTGSGD